MSRAERGSIDIGSIIWLIVLSAFIFIAGCPLYKSATSDGEIDYCYITQTNWHEHSKTILRGFIPWRSDLYIGAYNTDQDALDMAKKLHCRIGVKN